ncbi:MAG: hypothetical protein J6X28_00480 [Bacilli bacterium]|nr:hypothetical protein [Bacilli bacterium]
MPSIRIHEKVGDIIGKEIGISSYDYYLGLLAPDTPNIDDIVRKEDRWMAHQRRKDLEEWREAIDHFYRQEKDHYPKDFILGYYIHILTDIVYDDFFYLRVRDTIEETYSREESHQIMRQDMEKYTFDHLSDIKKILQEEDTSYDILNIGKGKLRKWKEKNCSSWDEKRKSQYVTDNIIDDLAKKVLEEYQERIGK